MKIDSKQIAEWRGVIDAAREWVSTNIMAESVKRCEIDAILDAEGGE